MKPRALSHRRFGRIFVRDKRDDKFLITLPRKTGRTSRYWNQSGWWGDQGATPQCVGYGWVHWLEDGPVTHGGKAPLVKPSEIYQLAQDLDEWDGEDYDGTSVRGGAKAMERFGYISEYRWTNKLEILIRTILETGPVVVGTAWWTGMCEPTSSGRIKISGCVEGGHCYVLNGANTKSKLFRIKNSWGRKWGRYGNAYIGFDDMGMLIEDMDGEVCLATEVPDAT